MSQRTEVPGIFKEREGVLINRDNEGLMAYKIRMEKAREAKSLREDVTELKKDMQEIKDLLKGLIK
jgi:hypothetical protein